MKDYIPAIIDLLTAVIPASLVFVIQRKQLLDKTRTLRVKNKHDDLKLGYLPQIMQLKCMEDIENSIAKIFKETRATRFLILVGVNGKEEMGHVSAIYSKNKYEVRIDQTKIYRSLEIDSWYKKMLKAVEAFGSYIIDVFEMEKSLLKGIYFKEGVSHSIVKFISRKSIDENNDFLMYCSFATDTEDPFDEYENLFITSEMNEIIIPSIKNLNKHEKYK